MATGVVRTLNLCTIVDNNRCIAFDLDTVKLLMGIFVRQTLNWLSFFLMFGLGH